MTIWKVIPVVILSGLNVCSYAQEQKTNEVREPILYTLENTDQIIFHSEINDVIYQIYVAFPPGYQNEPNKSFPVIYLLDADYSFAIAKNSIDHMAERNQLPEVIIVGIAYADKNQYRLNRTRDYTPTPSVGDDIYSNIANKSGGGPNFLKFMENELFPYMNSHYRINQKRYIVGHSFGGLFAGWVMLHKPETFNGYVLVSPSLWYDDHYLFELEEQVKNSLKEEELILYMAVGELEVNNIRNMPKDMQNFSDRLKSREYSNLKVQSEILSWETHNSIFPGAFTRGIRFLFAND